MHRSQYIRPISASLQKWQVGVSAADNSGSESLENTISPSSISDVSNVATSFDVEVCGVDFRRERTPLVFCGESSVGSELSGGGRDGISFTDAGVDELGRIEAQKDFGIPAICGVVATGSMVAVLVCSVGGQTDERDLPGCGVSAIICWKRRFDASTANCSC